MKTVLVLLVALQFVAIGFGKEPVVPLVPEMGSEEPLVLPKFEALAERPWLYAEIPGIRILSLASRRETAEFIQNVLDQQEFFSLLAPEIRRPESYTAFTIILKSPAFEKITAGRSDKISSRVPAPLHKSGDMQIEIYSGDGQGGFFFYLNYSAYLLNSQPELPEWYRKGLERSSIWLSQGADGDARIHGHSAMHVLLAKRKLETGASGGGKELVLWPLDRFFSVTSLDSNLARANRNQEENDIYDDQCVLFLHWGLRDGGEQRRTAFRRFVAAACQRPVDEELFRSCFGFGYEEGFRNFSGFARLEINKCEHVSLKPPDGSLDFLLPGKRREKKKPSGEIRPASSAEVIRTMSEVYLWTAVRYERGIFMDSRSAPPWDCRASNAWTKQHQLFLDKARNVMQRNAENNEPQMSAVRGFLEIGADNKPEAARLLQEAVTAHVQRPEAYLRLAQLQTEEALRDPRGTEGRPSREQLEPARELLREGLKQLPEMWMAYWLLAYTWSCSEGVPPSEELAVLVRAARWYPENTSMTREVAELCERAGNRDEAVALAKMGLPWAEFRRDGKMKADLSRLAGLSGEQP